MYFGISVLIHYCKLHIKNSHISICSNVDIYHSVYSTDTFTSWSKEGIKTEVLVNSTTVKCLSDHLSSFAVIAEDTTIEIPTDTTVTTATTATTSAATTDITTSMKLKLLLV